VQHADDLHPWQQSEEVFLELVWRFSRPGGLVLDPFAGSGTTGVACLRLGRRFIGCEINPETAAVARARLAEEERRLREASPSDASATMRSGKGESA
jgi:site-specific DNA-methyltransferase (adenine-specific)